VDTASDDAEDERAGKNPMKPEVMFHKTLGEHAAMSQLRFYTLMTSEVEIFVMF
jgi:hypothetical protein